MRCLRKLLGISYKDHITNKEVNQESQRTLRRLPVHSEKMETNRVWIRLTLRKAGNRGMEGGGNTLSYVVSTVEQTTEMMMMMMMMMMKMMKSHLWCTGSSRLRE